MTFASNPVPYIYDGTFLVVLVLFFCIYYKTGIVKALIQLSSFILSVVGAYFASYYAAPFIYENVFKQRLIDSVSGQLQSYRDGVISAFGDNAVGRALSALVNGDSSVLSGDVDAAAAQIVGSTLEASVILLIKVVVFVLVFLILYALLRALGKVSANINSVPVLGITNKILGGVFGLVVGTFVTFIIACSMGFALKFYSNEWFNDAVILKSSLFSVIYKLNPFFTS